LLIDASRSLLLFIDLQTKLVPAIDQAKICLSRCQMLLTAARRLNVPVIATEHCPSQVGNTVSELADRLAPSEIIEKRHFNGMMEPPLTKALRGQSRQMIVVAGMEAHVCVLQTVLGLKDEGYTPIVVADAVGSREPSSRDLAISRMRHQGTGIVNTEMVIFEWLEVGDSDEFKALLPMIKAGSID
jgi:nicotinamidase-related amidase